MGNRRIARIAGCCERTAQRARADLERDELIESFLLRPGEKLPQQRAAVRKLQVVRRVSWLQYHARIGLGLAPSLPRRKHGAADVPVEERVDPEFRKYIPAAYAVTMQPPAPPRRERRGSPPPPGAAVLVAGEVDEWERLTAQLEAEIAAYEPHERGPP